MAELGTLGGIKFKLRLLCQNLVLSCDEQDTFDVYTGLLTQAVQPVVY
jgi:hypothetical protein